MIESDEGLSKAVQLAVYHNRYCMPYENNKTVYHCSRPKLDLRRYWLVAKSPDKTFLRLLNAAGAQTAIDYYYEQKAINRDTLLFTETQLNTMGYDCMNKGEMDAALELFQLNRTLWPLSSAVYGLSG